MSLFVLIHYIKFIVHKINRIVYLKRITPATSKSVPMKPAYGPTTPTIDANDVVFVIVVFLSPLPMDPFIIPPSATNVPITSPISSTVFVLPCGAYGISGFLEALGALDDFVGFLVPLLTSQLDPSD